MSNTDKQFESEKAFIGSQLQKARKKAKLTQKQVAAKIGVRESTVSGWETGTTTISMGNLFFLHRIYRQPLAFFFPNQYSIGTPTVSDSLRSDISLQASSLNESYLSLLLEVAIAFADHEKANKSAQLSVLTKVKKRKGN